MPFQYAQFPTLGHLLRHLTSSRAAALVAAPASEDADAQAINITFRVLVCAPRDAVVSDADSPLRIPSQVPTLHRLHQAHGIQLFFVPTLAHLRVALSTGMGFGPVGVETSSEQAAATLATVVLVNCIALHTAVGQGAQGLGHTMALAVEAAVAAAEAETAAPTPVSLLFVECVGESNPLDAETEARVEVPATTRSETTRLPGWDTLIPILNEGSTGIPHRPWAAKKVPAARVVAQWCERIEVNPGEEDHDDGEGLFA